VNPSTLGLHALVSSAHAGFDPDGLTSNGKGLLYLASEQNNGDQRIWQYNLNTDKLTQLGKTTFKGLDDLAPSSGPGSPTPEPASLVLMGLGGVGLGGYALRQRKRRTA
jgi:hypothetical protein